MFILLLNGKVDVWLRIFIKREKNKKTKKSIKTTRTLFGHNMFDGFFE